MDLTKKGGYENEDKLEEMRMGNPSNLEFKPKGPERKSEEIKINYSEKLGQGNFGAVYRGKWGTVSVAVKILLSPENKEKFLKEEKIASELHHPGIISYYGWSIVETNKPVMIFELASYGRFDHYLMQHKFRLDIVDLLALATQIADSMNYLATKNLIHSGIFVLVMLFHFFNSFQKKI